MPCIAAGFWRFAARPPGLMGILNVTPDSFSDGGRFAEGAAAVAQARQLCAEGADVVDVGAESTRPGHQPISAEMEIGRLDPLLTAVVAAVDRPLSIDTSKAAVARYALARGASIVNDVWGLQRDPAMAETVAAAGAGLVIMHNRETRDPAADILAEIARFFAHSLDLADAAGISRDLIALDPGIGFGKTRDQNLTILKHLGALHGFGLPILLGLSRKRLFGDLLDAAPDARLAGTLAANLHAVGAGGVRCVRIHDVAPHRDAFRVAAAIADA